MWLRSFLLIVLLILCEKLLRQDYLEQKVFTWQVSLVILMSSSVSLHFLWENSRSGSEFLQSLGLKLLLLALPILSLVLLYRLLKQPGPADLKFIFCLFLLFDALEAQLLVLVACLWAFVSEWRMRKKAKADAHTFAFLPYLFLISWPFIWQKYAWIGV